MPEESRYAASPGYAVGQLEKALQRAAAEGLSPGAKKKIAQWRSVLDGMASGALTIGSRAPVADTPAWVTLEVAHGGFATGRAVAEAPLRADEHEQLATLPADVPGTTERERLNLWYLGDAGQAELLDALRSGHYQIEVPEDAALPVVAWLLQADRFAEALDLVAALRGFMHRLRFTPRLELGSAPRPGTVRVETAGNVRRRLESAEVNGQIAAMRETLSVWHPLYDRLVALWSETVDTDLPRLTAGGWPCRRWPADWARRRAQWLADYDTACREHTRATAHAHRKSNFARLTTALRQCEHDSSTLSARDVGWIRRALANTITKHGAPGSESRTAPRAAQAAIAARPTHAAIAHAIASRLDDYPDDGGISSVDPLIEDLDGHRVPPHLVAKVRRALEAPVEELVELGVIPSGETLAKVLPQITAGLIATAVDTPDLSALYAQTYAAFRRRRSLLLLNLEHQVQFGELPWIAAVAGTRTAKAVDPARDAVAQTALLAVSAFPQAILPNPLVRELGALATEAGLKLPLVEEVAADIFMGTFTQKWRSAAIVASRVMAGTLYARYYDLPSEQRWKRPRRRRILKPTGGWGKAAADDFTDLCAERATEAHTGSDDPFGYVAKNGAVIEQSQILTTHNLAVLVDALGLEGPLRERAPELAERVFDWVIRRQSQRAPSRIAALQTIKNVAYAWRQAIFLLSYCDQTTQHAAVDRLRVQADEAGLHLSFPRAIEGLAHVISGGQFTASGTAPDNARRLLGWSVGPHWCLTSEPATRAQHTT
jgi:hypothetical protein